MSALDDGAVASALDQVDVVVVTHNSADHLGRALDALGGGSSVVVVDNASSDGSAARAERRGATVVVNTVNAGFAAAANRGAALGSRPFVLFLNPDASIDRHDLAHLVGALEADPDLAVVSPRLIGPSGDQRVAWPLPSSARAWMEALLPVEAFRPGTGRGDGSSRRTPSPGFVVGACFLVRREAFEAAGGFDVRFWLYGEEAELCGRLVDAGWSIRVVEGATAVHQGGASAEGIEALVFEHFQRGAEHIVAKRQGGGAVRSLRLAELVGSLIRAAVPGSSERRAYHRRRLHRLARVLRHQPTRVALDSPATAAPGEGLVVCSLEAWDDVWRRNQFFVRELLAADPNRRVLFVEPPFDVLHEWRRRSGRAHVTGLRPLPADGRVVCFEPRKLWPRVLGPFADRSLRRQVIDAAGRLGLTRPDLWINDPSYAGLVDATDWPATYDVTDDWTEAGGSDRERERVVRREARLFDRAGSVVVCSEQLAVSRRKARPDLEVIPNAVDVAHFTRPRSRPPDLPESPVALYAGTLHEDRLDVDLVGRLASSRPDLSVVLVGPDSLSASSHAALAAHANVHLLGPRPYADVPDYLQHADVLVVPHVRSAFTESLDPIKAYECLAVGRPTVATPVAGFRDLGGMIVCAEPDAFAAAVDAALRSTAPPDQRVPADMPSWRARAAAFERCLVAARAVAAERPLRVVYLDHCAQPSGGELALVRLVRTLHAQQRIEAYVVLGEDGPLVDRLRAVGAVVEVQALDAQVASVGRDRVTAGGLGARRVTAAAGDTAALARRLRELQPDLVHTNSLKAAIYGGIAARAAGVPVVWHIRDRIAPDYLPSAAVRLVHNLARWVPSAVIVPSRSTSDTILGALGPGQPCHVVHDMVDPVLPVDTGQLVDPVLPVDTGQLVDPVLPVDTGQLVDPVLPVDTGQLVDPVLPVDTGQLVDPVLPVDTGQLVDPVLPVARRDGPFRVVMVGRLAPWKGQHVLLDAFATAFPDGDEQAVVVGSAMFGEDDYEADLHAQVAQLGLADRVRFTGFVEDVPAELAEADCVVHASVIAEPFGQVVVEAMAAGRAVIASDLGGPREIVTDGVDGLLCPPDDRRALADRLVRLARRPELRAALGRAAVLRARDFSPDVIGPRIAACYDEVLALRRVGSRSGR